MNHVRAIVAYLALAGGLGLALLYIMSLPPQDTPWSELDLDQPVGVFTEFKLAQMNNRQRNCRMLLEDSEIQFTALPDEQFGNNCAFDNVVNLERSVTPYSAPVNITCPGAAALYLWERDTLQPAAREHFGVGITQIVHYGTYSCRRVNNASSGRFSEHATANAIDIAAFRLEDGRTITVEKGWNGDAAASAFLHVARDGACRTFRGVLSPDYNAAHYNHFHLDMGPYDLCR